MGRSIFTTFAIWIALVVVQVELCAQRPQVSTGGIVNAATFGAQGQPGYGVTPGSLASVFGRNLAAGTFYAAGFPLPTNLGGTSVTIGGLPAPLIYVSPTQINLQVPFGLTSNEAPLVVTTCTGSSDPMPVPYMIAPGLFTLDASGCGRGAVFNVASDGKLSLNGPENSIEPGGIIALFGTGLAFAAYSGLLTDGMPAPADPPARYTVPVMPILRGLLYSDLRYQMYIGAAPGFAGLDQFNLRLPDDAPEACSLPLELAAYGRRTQLLPISVRRGGGRCSDPPPDSSAVFIWTKTVATGISPPPATDTLSIEFASAIGKQAPVLPLRGSNEFDVWDVVARPGGEVLQPGRYCPGFEDRHLDAGSLTVDGPGLSVRVDPVLSNGVLRYSAKLPAGAIKTASYRVAGSGGAGVGAFTTSVSIPEPIRLMTSFPPGTRIPNDQLTVRWEGGDPNSIVTLKVIIKDYAYYLLSAPTSQGYITMMQPGQLVPAGPAEIVVTQTPDPAHQARFQATGLTLGGWHLWLYEFRFGGLQA
jgi:uncharacterized protein (TIGR03437 family)